MRIGERARCFARSIPGDQVGPAESLLAPVWRNQQHWTSRLEQDAFEHLRPQRAAGRSPRPQQNCQTGAPEIGRPPIPPRALYVFDAFNSNGAGKALETAYQSDVFALLALSARVVHLAPQHIYVHYLVEYGQRLRLRTLEGIAADHRAEAAARMDRANLVEKFAVKRSPRRLRI